MKTTVVYHSADYDGIFCREIARKFLPDAELIGWNFGDSPIKIGPYDSIYVLDLPVYGTLILDGKILCALDANRIDGLNITWIDHHKTSIEDHQSNILGYRIDGVAACRLAWQWFHGTAGVVPNMLGKSSYVDRMAEEPLAVRLAGEYDVWDHRGDGDVEFQFGLRSRDLIQGDWDDMLEVGNRMVVDDLLRRGKVAMDYSSRIDADLVKHRSYRLKWEGLDFLVLNTGRFNSLTFAALDVLETGHDALMGYMFNGKCWTVSLYHAKHRTDIDLSEIAKKYGGGGHRGACGFTCDKLPFHP